MRQDYFLNEKADHVFARFEQKERYIPSIQGLLRILEADPDDLVACAGVGEGRFAMALARYMAEARGRGVIFACDTSEKKITALESNFNFE